MFDNLIHAKAIDEGCQDKQECPYTLLRTVVGKVQLAMEDKWFRYILELETSD